MEHRQVESYDNTIVWHHADPPIVDAHGIAYRLEVDGTITMNDIEDRTIQNVSKLAYVQRMVWAHGNDGFWYSRHSADEDWSEPVEESPLIHDQLAVMSALVDAIDTRLAVLTIAVNNLSETVSHLATRVAATQGAVFKILARLSKEGELIMVTLADIQTAVRNEKTVEDSMMVLLQSIAGQLQAALANNDTAAMQAIVDQLYANTQAMTDAVIANTQHAPSSPPAAPPAPPAEPSAEEPAQQPA